MNSWTEKAKAAVDAEFVQIMSPGTPVDKTPLEGLAGAPEIVLDPHFDHDDCKADAAWRSRWAGVFQRLHWTDPQQPPAISLKHFFSCVYAYGAPPRYFALSDTIFLSEANVVFPLNGKLVRKWVSLVTAHHEQFALEDDLASRLADFVPRNIQDFLTDLVLGNSSDVPPIPSGSNPPALMPIGRSTAAAACYRALSNFFVALPSGVPPALRGVMGNIALPGEPFDASDVYVKGHKHSRYIFVWNIGNRWIVATEQGGIALHVANDTAWRTWSHRSISRAVTNRRHLRLLTRMSRRRNRISNHRPPVIENFGRRHSR